MPAVSAKRTRILDAELLARGAQVYKVLSHHVRLRIVELLMDEQLSVSDLADEMEMPQASISQHLNLLRSSNVVEGKRRGQKVFYSVTSPLAHSMIHCLQEHGASIWRPR
jgi:ArsR family transcriptional regulator